MKKSLLALLLALAMLAPAGVVWSEEPVSDGKTAFTAAQTAKFNLLYEMGITESAEISDAPVTRGEFAAWVAAMSGMNSGVLPYATRFSDVSSSNKYARAVAVVSALGCMNGVSETEFGVSKEITYFDAQVTLVRLLGYEKAAQMNGGYPAGYAKYAASLKLGSDTVAADGNERAAILLMCYNSLTAPFVDTDGEATKENTLLGKLHGIYEAKGIVTANRFTCLDTEKIRLNNNEIEIGGVVYITEDASLAEYIGEFVSCYYFYNEKDDERSIIYLKPETDRVETLVLTHEQILSAKDNTISYEDEDGDTELAELRPGFDFILNNRVVMDRTTSDLDLADGELTLIDADGDGLFELAKAKSPETMIYQGADNMEDMIYCKEGNIYTNAYDKTYYSEYIRVDELDKTQKQISLDELTAGDVLTVYRSKDDKYLKIYAISAGVYGTLEEVSDEEVVIDGVTYDVPLKTPVSELIAGSEVAFSVDMFGRLVYLDGEDDSVGPQYGYFFAYEAPKGLANARVKFIIGDETQIYPLADSVKVDDASSYGGDELTSCAALFESGAAVRQLVRFCADKNGEVTDIYTAAGNAENSIRKTPDTDKNIATKYYQWRNIWGGKYVLPPENFFLVVPTVGDEAEKEELYGTSYAFNTDVNNCYVEIFDVDDNMEAGAVLLYSQTALEGQATTTVDTAVGIITKITKGEENNFVYLWSNGENKSYEVNGDNIPSLAEFGFGDVVRYVVAKDGKVSTLFKMLDVGASGETTLAPALPSDGYDNHYFGRVYRKLDDYLVLIPNADNPGFDTAVDKRIVAPSAYGTCAVIDMKSQKVISGTYDSVSQYFDGDGSGGCYVYTRIYKWTTCKDLFIYRF